MLGHEIAFAYCRQPAADAPCRKLLDCWWETFDVRTWASRCLTEPQQHALAQRRPDKAASLVDLINQARRRTRQS